MEEKDEQTEIENSFIKIGIDPTLTPDKNTQQVSNSNISINKSEIEDQLVLQKSEQGSNSSETQSQSENSSPKETLFLKEDQEKGRVSFKLLLQSFKLLGGFAAFSSILGTSMLVAAANLVSNYLILSWAQNYYTEDPKSQKIKVFTICGLLLGQNMLVLIRTNLITFLVISICRKTHSGMTYRLLHSKIPEFLDRVPSGQILNRFSKDIDGIDTLLWSSMSRCYMYLAYHISDIALVLYTTKQPLFFIPYIIFAICSFSIQNTYMRAKADIQRLEKITRSPIVSWLSQSLRGMPEIRALNLTNFIKEKMENLVDNYSKNPILLYGLDLWFSGRQNFINIIFIQLPCYIYLLARLYSAEGSGAAKDLIIFIVLGLRMSSVFCLLLQAISDMETVLISFERCEKFEKIEPEDQYKNFKAEEKKFKLPKEKVINEDFKRKNELNLIKEGRVEFEGVCARYPMRSTNAIDNITLSVSPGEKIGVVGRTGAGKTSFIKLFWLGLRPSQGRLLLDGVDVASMDLKLLRSSVMVVSQESAIFEGSLAENVNPEFFSIKNENFEIIKKLAELGFSEEKLEREGGLKMRIENEGGNLSQGEQQVVSFLRTLLNPKKIVILDEATANIDLETEKRIQAAIKKTFEHSTMFIIAHRVQTVMECDRVLVLDKGTVSEFDTPENLLKKPESAFGAIVKKLEERSA